jgi:hypothetical protein
MSWFRRPGAGFVLACALVLQFACGGGGGLFGRVYEYEEDLYVSLDGSANLIINTSIPALVALRGLHLDVNPAAPVDRDEIRAAYESSITDVTRVSRPWRRNNRRYVQIRLKVTDVRRLSEVSPFSWSQYQLVPEGSDVVFRQKVGASAHRPGTLTNVGWNGSELVAFRLHLPSRIRDHNARDLEQDIPSDIQRGNILAWEQHLADRLDGRPIEIAVRMDPDSILYRTLWLFGGAFLAAVLLLGGIIWMTIRKGARQAAAGV